MDGIKSDALNPVTTQIMVDATLRGDFDRCVSLYKDFLSQRAHVPHKLNVSALKTGDGGEKFTPPKSFGKDGGTVEDRYYTI